MSGCENLVSAEHEDSLDNAVDVFRAPCWKTVQFQRHAGKWEVQNLLRLNADNDKPEVAVGSQRGPFRSNWAHCHHCMKPGQWAVPVPLPHILPWLEPSFWTRWRPHWKADGSHSAGRKSLHAVPRDCTKTVYMRPSLPVIKSALIKAAVTGSATFCIISVSLLNCTLRWWKCCVLPCIAKNMTYNVTQYMTWYMLLDLSFPLNYRSEDASSVCRRL